MTAYMNSSDNEEGSKVDASAWFARALRYLSHARLMLVCLALGLIAGVVYFVFGKPVYYSRSLLSVTVLALPVNSESGKTSDSSATSANRTLALRSFQRQLLSDHIQLRVAQKLGVAGPSDSPESVRQFAIPSVEISFLDSDFLEVGVYSYYPEVVRKYAETLIAEYTTQEKEVTGAFRARALDTYVKELDEYKARLDDHLKRRMEFEESNSLAQLFVEQSGLTQVPREIVLTKERLRQMGEVRARLASEKDTLDVITRLSLLTSVRYDDPVEVGTVVRNPASGTIEARLPAAQSASSMLRSGEYIVSPSMVESMEPWRDLEKRQRELRDEQRRATSIYQPGHASMQKFSSELATLDTKLQAELDVAQQKFDIEFARHTDRLKSLEAKVPEYNEVTAKYEKYRQDYQLMEKGQLDWDKAHSELALNVARLQFGADKERIHVDFGGTVALRDSDPVSPNKMKLALIGGGLGLLLAFGVPTLLMLWDTSVNRLIDIEERTGVNGLGLIPLSSRELLEDIFRSPILDARVPNFILEAHRIIRSGIMLHPNRKDQSQVVMVTSARPTEGKTTLSANLAWAFHSMGESVLLVDCDLRRGRVADIVQLPNQTGISTLLMNEEAGDELIQHTRSSTLDVITRGPIVAGATELLCCERLEEIVAGWRLKYDRIILDTPPVLGLSETASLQRVVDGVVLVVRAHRTLTKDVVDAIDMLRRAGAHMFGLVLNAVDLSKLSNHYTYYYYSPLYYSEMEVRQQAPAQ
jgi:capsular exopolysaccharide synthesis family protein